MFRKQSLKIAFDALYGLYNDNIAIHEMIELIAYFYYDGKIDGEQGSKFELDLCKILIDQMRFENDSELSPRNLALCWIFCKAHARNPAGISIEVSETFVTFYKAEVALTVKFQAGSVKCGLLICPYRYSVWSYSKNISRVKFYFRTFREFHNE